jgi:hypothetical protein
MSELKIKTGVKPRILVIAAAVINAANEIKLPVDIVITSGNDSKHMKKSKHYTYEALDFRSKTMTSKDVSHLIGRIRKRLGKNYDTILENVNTPNEHIHIEYDPKQ